MDPEIRFPAESPSGGFLPTKSGLGRSFTAGRIATPIVPKAAFSGLPKRKRDELKLGKGSPLEAG
jgi:hypothetical protein